MHSVTSLICLRLLMSSAALCSWVDLSVLKGQDWISAGQRLNVSDLGVFGLRGRMDNIRSPLLIPAAKSLTPGGDCPCASLITADTGQRDLSQPPVSDTEIHPASVCGMRGGDREYQRRHQVRQTVTDCIADSSSNLEPSGAAHYHWLGSFWGVITIFNSIQTAIIIYVIDFLTRRCEFVQTVVWSCAILCMRLQSCFCKYACVLMSVKMDKKCEMERPGKVWEKEIMEE